jgi:hypothetical protein
MKKISSSNYPLTRLVIPIVRQTKVWVPMVLLSLLLVVTGLWLLLVCPLMVLLMMAAIHYSPNIVFTNFCKDAWVNDTSILLQFKQDQVCIPFNQIQAITWHGSNNPPRARITLKTATQFGLVFTFIPDLTGGRNQAKKTIETLNNQLVRSL